MPHYEAPTLAQLQAQCDAWNAKHAEGTMVSYEEVVGDGETFRGRTQSEAQVLSGHSAVVWLKGKSGCVCLEHCTAVKPTAEDLAREAAAVPA